MANKRKLKKNINFLCSELFAECISCMQYNQVNNSDANSAILSILKMQEDMICRISHIEPGMKAKDFFGKLRNDLARQTEEIVDQINSIL